jgi:pSer/pThr/pTyr-binding forkhead associated (FHA) protein
VKCPSCGTVGELEGFVRAAAAGVEDSTPPGEMAPEAEEETHEAATVPVMEAPGPVAGPPPAEAQEASGGGTQISGIASELNLPPGVRCTITVLSGPDSGKKLTLTKARAVVGRENGDLPLTDQEISGEHCAFEITGVTCTVKDLGSRNGTYVDGEKITTSQLSNVGEVSVGNTTLLFTMTLEDELPEG